MIGEAMAAWAATARTGPGTLRPPVGYDAIVGLLHAGIGADLGTADLGTPVGAELGGTPWGGGRAPRKLSTLDLLPAVGTYSWSSVTYDPRIASYPWLTNRRLWTVRMERFRRPPRPKGAPW
jgi:hypothetical protein